MQNDLSSSSTQQNEKINGFKVLFNTSLVFILVFFPFVLLQLAVASHISAPSLSFWFIATYIVLAIGLTTLMSILKLWKNAPITLFILTRRFLVVMLVLLALFSPQGLFVLGGVYNCYLTPIKGCYSDRVIYGTQETFSKISLR